MNGESRVEGAISFVVVSKITKQARQWTISNNSTARHLATSFTVISNFQFSNIAFKI